MQLYFAAPLFNEAEKAFNRRVVGRLEAEDHEVFLPQRDGVESIEALVASDPDIEGTADAMNRIFALDRAQIQKADVVTALLDGQVPDEGVALEMGLAHAHDTPIVGLKTDVRVHAQDEPLKAMLWGALDELTATVDEFVATLEEYRGQGD